MASAAAANAANEKFVTSNAVAQVAAIESALLVAGVAVHSPCDDASQLPAFESALLVSGMAVPSDNNALPVSGVAIPADNNSLPVSGVAIRSDNNSLLVSAIPSDNNSLLVSAVAVPSANCDDDDSDSMLLLLEAYDVDGAPSASHSVHQSHSAAHEKGALAENNALLEAVENDAAVMKSCDESLDTSPLLHFEWIEEEEEAYVIISDAADIQSAAAVAKNTSQTRHSHASEATAVASTSKDFAVSPAIIPTEPVAIICGSTTTVNPNSSCLLTNSSLKTTSTVVTSRSLFDFSDEEDTRDVFAPAPAGSASIYEVDVSSTSAAKSADHARSSSKQGKRRVSFNIKFEAHNDPSNTSSSSSWSSRDFNMPLDAPSSNFNLHSGAQQRGVHLGTSLSSTNGSNRDSSDSDDLASATTTGGSGFQRGVARGYDSSSTAHVAAAGKRNRAVTFTPGANTADGGMGILESSTAALSESTALDAPLNSSSALHVQEVISSTTFQQSSTSTATTLNRVVSHRDDPVDDSDPFGSGTAAARSSSATGTRKYGGRALQRAIEQSSASKKVMREVEYSRERINRMMFSE